MLSQNQYDRILPRLKLIRLIYGALGLGLIVLAIPIAILTDWKQLTTEAGYTSFIGALTGLIMFCTSFVVPKLLTLDAAQLAAQLSQKRRSTDIDDDTIIDQLVSNAMIFRILVVALLEGGIFLNVITFFVEHATVSISVIVIGLVIYMLRFPFVAQQISRIERDLVDVKHELELIDIR